MWTWWITFYNKYSLACVHVLDILVATFESIFINFITYTVVRWLQWSHHLHKCSWSVSISAILSQLWACHFIMVSSVILTRLWKAEWRACCQSNQKLHRQLYMALIHHLHQRALGVYSNGVVHLVDCAATLNADSTTVDIIYSNHFSIQDFII